MALCDKCGANLGVRLGRLAPGCHCRGDRIRVDIAL